MKISLLIPVTSNKRSFKKIEDSPLISVLLKSFLKYKEEGFEYTFYVGYDKGDRFYTLNKNDISEYFEDKVNIEYIEYLNPEHSPVFIWNKLFEEAYNNNEDYFYQIGDDIEINSKWTSKFTQVLELNSIGVTGPLDTNNKLLLTQSFVTRKHMDIFGYYFPYEFKNWYCDNWIQDTYKGCGKLFKCEDILVRNSGGSPRYVINKSPQTILKSKVKEGALKIKNTTLIKGNKFKTTILIPYRNRETHLNYLLENTIPLLNDNMENIKILIIEQKKGGHFNKGRLLNVGILESDSDYYIPQEVDVNPYKETIIEYYNKDISINGIYCSAANTLGGIIKISKEDIFKINGYTNDYWGWGCEDKNLQNRAEHFNLKIHKNILNNEDRRHDYFKIFNDVDDRVKIDLHNKTEYEYEKFKELNESQQLKSIMESGLNNIEYEIIERENISENVEKILVDIGTEQKPKPTNTNNSHYPTKRVTNPGLNRVRKNIGN